MTVRILNVLADARDTLAASKTPETPVGETVGWVSEWTGMEGKVCRTFHDDRDDAEANAKWMDGRSYAVKEATPAQPDSGVVEALREKVSDRRRMLARWLLNPILDEDEAMSVVSNHPAIRRRKGE